MNPLTNVRNIKALNENDIKNGIFDHKHTWHSQYKDSAYIFIGGLPYDLTEGDVLCVFSQYGEIVNINLVRDKKTGKSQGYCFICYQDQRSTILAVDNLNSIKLGGRTIRVDHVLNYRPPKSDEKDESGNYKIKDEESCAPKTPSPEPVNVHGGKKKKKKVKKEKKKKKKEHKLKEEENSRCSSETDEERRKEYKRYLDREREKSQSKWDQVSIGKAAQIMNPNASSSFSGRNTGHDSDSESDGDIPRRCMEEEHAPRDSFKVNEESSGSYGLSSLPHSSKGGQDFDSPSQLTCKDVGSPSPKTKVKQDKSPPRKRKKNGDKDSGRVKLSLGKMKFKKK